MNDFRRLFPYIRPNIHLLIVSLLLLVASGALETVVIMLLAPIFNQLSSRPRASRVELGEARQHHLPRV